MLLEGSCHCGAVRFSVESRTPYPYMRCYCSICRKTGGGGGYAINIMGEAATFKVDGIEHIGIYHARMPDGKGAIKHSSAKRHFCRDCGSSLYLSDERWPEWIYPLASAIDTPLPVPPEVVSIMLDFAAPWAEVSAGKHFREYPKESIEDWHRRHQLTD